MKNLSYEQSREKIYELRDDGKFLQAIEVSQHLSNELLEDLEHSNIPEEKKFILFFLMNNYYIEGTILRQVNNFFQSDVSLNKGLQIANELDDIQTTAKIYSALANNQYQNGFLEQSLSLLRKGLELIKDSDFITEKIMIQGNIGQILCILGDFDTADELLTFMLNELERLEKREFFGNAYFSLAMLKYYKSLFEEALLLFERALYEYQQHSKPRNMFMSTVELIRTNIQLGNIEKAELLIESLSKIEFEGKGEKEELEKLLLFVHIFIARKEYSIAKYSLEATLDNLNTNSLVIYKIIIMYLRAALHCLENENNEAMQLITSIKSELQNQQYIIYQAQTNYIQAWAEFNGNQTENAKKTLELSFVQTNGKIFHFGMFFLPHPFKEFLETQHQVHIEKQQS